MKEFNPNQESQGIGDTIAKITNFFGIDKVADAVAKLAGAEGCGCDERRQMLNELFPYENKTRKFRILKQFQWGQEIYFEGQEINIGKTHNIFPSLIVLVQDKMIEEI